MHAKEIKKPADPGDIEAIRSSVFSEADRQTLKRHEVMAEAVARMFGSGCEVVIHSFEDLAHSIVKIFNGEVTGRTVGSPITDLGLKLLKSEEPMQDVIGTYYSITKAGKPLKSVSSVIRNNAGLPIGFFCINFDLSMPLNRFVEGFFPPDDGPTSSENFAPDVRELVGKSVADELEAVSRITGVSPTEKNRRIVHDLENRGVFGIKGSVELVAGELGVTKHTIYKYLRELRGDR